MARHARAALQEEVEPVPPLPRPHEEVTCSIAPQRHEPSGQLEGLPAGGPEERAASEEGGEVSGAAASSSMVVLRPSCHRGARGVNLDAGRAESKGGRVGWASAPLHHHGSVPLQ